MRDSRDRPIDREDIDRLVNRVLRFWKAPGAAVAVVAGDEVYVQGYGVRELGKPDPVTPETLFAIASNTKPFTTAAVAILVGEGRMAWDDHPRKYVPYFRLSDPVADSNVTLRDLACHRTGMPRHDDLWCVTDWSREEIICRYGLAPAKHPFRTTFEYANIPFMVIGEAIASAAKCSYEEFVKGRIFDLLGMTAANFSAEATRKYADYAMPHVKKKGRVTAIPWRNLDREAAAGGINASALDMSKWVRMLLSGGELDGVRIISKESLKETQRPHTVTSVENPDKYDFDCGSSMGSYCLGWGLKDYRGHIVTRHGGYVNGFTSEVALVPRSGLGIAVLVNSVHAPVVSSLANSLLDELLDTPKRDWCTELQTVGKAQEAEEKRVKSEAIKHRRTRPSRSLDAYVGEYEHPAYGTVRVTREDYGLLLTYHTVSGKLKHYHYDVFSLRLEFPVGTSDFKVIFRLDEKGHVAWLKIVEIENIEYKRVGAGI